VVRMYTLLGNGAINTHSRQQKTVFSVVSVPRNYKRAQSEELEEYEEYSGVQRSIQQVELS
jgi:hypothetical protein